MSKIPTAYQFCQSKCLVDDYGKPINNLPEAMVEFAKLHVEAALESAVESADLIETDGDIDPKTILNAYPEENIK